MPIEGFSIGKDAQLDLVHPTLGIIPLGLVTGFNPRPITTRLTSIPITNGGVRVNRVVYGGWEGEIEMDRATDTLDALITFLEANYFAGESETYFLLTQSIRNPDGSIAEYRYVGAVLDPQDAGNYRGEEKVPQRMMFVAQRRTRV